MTGRIPQDVLDRVLSAHDVVDVVSRYVPLQKAGRTYRALCPFHDEKTPSFHVSPERQTFKCFGCGKGGNVFGFLMERERMTFPEAVRHLAQEKGIEVPRSGHAGPSDGSATEGLRAAIDLAQALYVRTLAGGEGDSTRAYLARRGFPPEAVAEFGLGLSPGRWDGLLEAARAKGIPAATIEEAGLAIPRDSGSGAYDRFRGRLMFPVADAQGRVVTFAARALGDEQPKYLNGPETPLFRKGRTLYGLDRAKEGIRRAGHAILMEGYTDVLMAHLHGVTAAVAGMGTAFTSDQARLLARHAERVVVLYDGDRAGRVAAESSLDVLLEEGLEVRIALLPEGKDVDEVVLEEGVESLEAIVRAARDLFDFKIEQIATRTDLTSARGKATAAEDLLASARRVANPLERDLLIERIADRFGLRERLLRERAAEDRTKALRRAVPASLREGSAPRPAAPIDPRERDLRREQECLVSGVLHRPEWFASVAEELALDPVLDPGLAALWRTMEACAADGEGVTLSGVARRVAQDAAASAALASVPDDVRFDEWIPEALAMRRRRRDLEVRRRALLDRIDGAPSASRGPPPLSEGQGEAS